MTWCLGFGLFQFSVLMGAIRTSKKDGVTGEYRPLDVGISKITLLGPNLAVGFSGSVCIGRRVLELMERKAATYEGELWHPDKVISWTRAYLAEHYESDYPSEERKAGLCFLFVAQAPYLPPHLPDYGIVAKICYPRQTDPNRVPPGVYERRNAFQVMHIGDYRAAEKYAEALPRLRANNSLFGLIGFHKAAPGKPLPAQILSRAISDAVARDPTDTISDEFVVATVALDAGAMDSNRGMFGRPAGSVPIARNYDEYVWLLHQSYGEAAAVLAEGAVA